MKKKVMSTLIAATILIAINVYAGIETYGSKTLEYMWGNYGSEDGQFNSPYGVAVDSDGDIDFLGGFENGGLCLFEKPRRQADSPSGCRNHAGRWKNSVSVS